jgi:Phage P22-like portal protein
MTDVTGMVAAGNVANGGGKKNSSEDVLATARTRMNMAIGALSESRENEIDDLRFYAGSPDNQWQWPADVLATRGAVQGQSINARPCLTINKLPQHVHQVTNDMRQNRPGAKVIPVDDKADVEVAEVFNGMIRHIEYISDADVAYDTACENQVSYGEGYIRLLTDYCDPNSFEQDIKIGRVRNSFSVYMDPTIQDPTGADAKWCFVTEDIDRGEYARLYPNAAPITTLQSLGIGDQNLTQWLNENTIRIADYYYVDYDMKTLNLYPGNVTAFEGSREDKAYKEMYGKPKKSRKVQNPVIRYCKINGYEILEENVWAGQWIPVIRVVGNEFEVDGRLYVSGLVRNAKDAQRMYNYWVSQEAEMLALAPKAPFIGYGGQFEGYEDKWKTANTNNWPYLEVNPDVTDGSGSVLPLPQRAQPPMASSGLLQAKSGAAEDIKSTTGQYNASLGMGSNERSGKAILARQKEGDVGTYHYGDNLSRAVRHVARQLVDLIPKIYDTERIARIIGEDGETKMAKINPEQQEPVKEIRDMANPDIVIEKIYNPSVGKYDVVASTGPGYATKRQEALEAMAQLLQGNPDLWKVAGDLFVKNMDWPGAQEMAKRFAKTIDPKIMEDGNKSPELQAAEQQIQAMGAEMENMHKMLQNVNQSVEVQEQKRKDFEAQVKAYDAETKRIQAVQAGMSEEQIQDIVMGTVHGMITSGDLLAEMPSQDLDVGPEMMPEQMEQQPVMPPEGMPQ